MGDLFDDALVTLAHAHGVDNHPLLALKLAQQLVEGLLGVKRVHGDVQQAGINAQLLVGADTKAVRGHQRYRPGAVAHDEPRRELGRGGGFAHAGGADQRDNAGLVKKGVLLVEHGELIDQLLAQPAKRGIAVFGQRGHVGRQRGQQLTGNFPAKANIK